MITAGNYEYQITMSSENLKDRLWIYLSIWDRVPLEMA